MREIVRPAPRSEPIYCCATSVEITLQGHEGPEGYLMSASDQIYLVMDAGTPVAAFTAQQALKAYLRRRLDTRSQTAASQRSRHRRGRWRTEKSWLTITMMVWGAFLPIVPACPLDALPRTARRRKAIHEIAGTSIWAKRRSLTYADVDCRSFCSHQASGKKGQLKSERHGTSPTLQARHVLQSASLHVGGRPRASDHDPVKGVGR
jgi:hypothetical protein